MGEFLVCGDFNARCGILDDAPNPDNIPIRVPVDKTSNQVGKSWLKCFVHWNYAYLMDVLTPPRIILPLSPLKVYL